MKIKDILTEAPLADYDFIGDFTKPGPFNAVNKKLVQHPIHIEKAYKFFANTDYPIRVIMCNVRGTQRFKETGDTSPDRIKTIFSPPDAAKILNDFENSITIVYIGNTGADPVPLTPWVMAHRFGHAIQASNPKSRYAWKEAEKYFFRSINDILKNYYGKVAPIDYSRMQRPEDMQFRLQQEYNALFNAIGTQRSSRENKIRRPYEFLYELFVQYINSGEIKLNPLPASLDYGRKAWGKPTKYMRLNPDGQEQMANATDQLAYDLSMYFSDVMTNAEGHIYLM